MFDMEGRLCYEVVTMSVVASVFALVNGRSRSGLPFFVGSAAMPEGLNRVIQPSVFQQVLKEMHGAAHD